MRDLYELWFQIAARIESSWNFFLILHIALLGVNLAKRVRFGIVPCLVFAAAYAMFVYVNATGLLFNYEALNALALDIHEAHESAKFLPHSQNFLAHLAEHGGADDYVWRIAVTHGVAAAYIAGLISLFYLRGLEGRPALWELGEVLGRLGPRVRRAAVTPPPGAGAAAPSEPQRLEKPLIAPQK